MKEDTTQPAVDQDEDATESQDAAEEQSTPGTKKVRHQVLSLPEAVAAIKLLVNSGGPDYSLQDAAGTLGGSINSGTNKQRMATLVRFGFLERLKGGGWRLTNKGRVVAERPNTPEFFHICQEAFEKAPHFSDIGARFSCRKYGEDNMLLRNFVRIDLKVPTKKTVSKIVNTYLDSRRFLDGLGAEPEHAEEPEQPRETQSVPDETPLVPSNGSHAVFQAVVDGAVIKKTAETKDDLPRSVHTFIEMLRLEFADELRAYAERA